MRAGLNRFMGLRAILIMTLAFCPVLRVLSQVESPRAGKAEPIYQGRPLSYWIGMLKLKPKDDDTRQYLNRTRAINALRAIGQPAIPALVEALHDKNMWVRGGAISALDGISQPTKESIDALTEALSDKENTIRGLAALVLGSYGAHAKSAVSALVRLMESGQQLSNKMAAQALGKIGPDAKAAIPALAAALKDADQSVVASAAGALYRIDPSNNAAITTLVGILKESKNTTARATAAGALGDSGAPTASIMPALVDGLRDPAANVRLVTAKALQRVDKGSHPSTTALIRMLDQKDEFLAGMAADALTDAKVALPDVLEGLQAALRSNTSVSVHAAESLWKLQPNNQVTIPALIKALTNENKIARLGGCEALTAIGPQAKVAVPALLRAIRDGDEQFRALAEEALRAIDPDAAAKAGLPGEP